jgi:hypothetical protein
MKITWKVINNGTGKTQHDMSVPSFALYGKIITNQKIIANLFNNYFLSLADY